MKAFNPLHTACLLLINETAKEKEKEPNTVSKDKGHVGTCSQLAIQISFALVFKQGFNMLWRCVCTSFKQVFPFFWE